MSTIAVSPKVYRKVIVKKQEMEREKGKIVTMGDALDAIVEDTELGKNKREEEKRNGT